MDLAQLIQAEQRPAVLINFTEDRDNRAFSKDSAQELRP
jgi:hypothetical protein